MKNSVSRFSTVFMVVALVCCCIIVNPTLKTSRNPVVAFMGYSTVWDRMRADFSIDSLHQNVRVQKFVKMYLRNSAQDLIALSHNSVPYLYYVVSKLEERGLPLELALLPFIESEFRLHVVSRAGASGLWQLASCTAKLYGIKQDNWYDGRKDLEAATEVALRHIEYLYKEFNQDWLLTLAAYNCGDGRVKQAIRNNKKLGKPTDYWSLNLPKDTQYYVPKFLALVHVIKNAKSFDLALPTIPNKPYLAKVNIEKQIDLQNAAKFAELDYAQVKKYNAAYKSNVTHPSYAVAQHIMLPTEHVDLFKANYAQSVKKPESKKAVTPKPNIKKSVPAKAKPAVNTTNKSSKPKAVPAVNKVKSTATARDSVVHTVHRGDTLNVIAAKYQTTVRSIKQKNNLKSDIIRTGQVLAI